MGLTADLGLFIGEPLRGSGCDTVGDVVRGEVIRGGVVRVGGFAIRVDDWEVTRPRVTTAR